MHFLDKSPISLTDMWRFTSNQFLINQPDWIWIVTDLKLKLDFYQENLSNLMVIQKYLLTTFFQLHIQRLWFASYFHTDIWWKFDFQIFTWCCCITQKGYNSTDFFLSLLNQLVQFQYIWQYKGHNTHRESNRQLTVSHKTEIQYWT